MAFSCHFPNSSNFDQPFFRQKCHTKREREIKKEWFKEKKWERQREWERERKKKKEVEKWHKIDKILTGGGTSNPFPHLGPPCIWKKDIFFKMWTHILSQPAFSHKEQSRLGRVTSSPRLVITGVIIRAAWQLLQKEHSWKSSKINKNLFSEMDNFYLGMQ